MTASTITFAVQLGSDGFAVARGVAERLKYHYLDWEITSRAANEAGVSPEMVAASEQNRPTLHRIVQSLMASSSLINEDVTLLSGPSAAAMSSAIGMLNTDGYRYFVESVVREVAERGEAVIVGHAGQVILQGEGQALKVLVCGSARVRAQRLASETGQSFETAISSVQKSDKERKDFFKRAYGVNLTDPELYDLTVNTDHLPTDAIIEGVLGYAGLLAGPIAEPVAESATPEPATTTAPELVGREEDVPAIKQRDALLRAEESLEAAMNADASKAKDWAKGVVNSVAALKRIFERHVRESEAAGGSLSEVVTLKPHLARRVAQIKEDHARIQNDIGDFVSEVNQRIASGDLGIDALKEHIVRVQVALRLHESRGSSLLHEAYLRDEGGESH